MSEQQTPLSGKPLHELVAELRAENERLRKENDTLRAIATKIMPCHYCGVDNVAKCPYGFPGCSLADDEVAYGDTIGNEIKALRARCEAMQTELRDIASATMVDPEKASERMVRDIVRVVHQGAWTVLSADASAPVEVLLPSNEELKKRHEMGKCAWNCHICYQQAALLAETAVKKVESATQTVPLADASAPVANASNLHKTVAKNWVEELEHDNAILRRALERLRDGDHVGTSINKDCGAMKVIEETLDETSAVQVIPLADAQALVEALDAIASWKEGPVVTTSFDEPASAAMARDALAAWREKHP